MTEELGDFESFCAEWTQEIEDGTSSTTEKGRRFASKILSQFLEAERGDDDIVYCDGAQDGGIDAAYLLRNEDGDSDAAVGDTWYLVQSKYGSAFQGDSTLLKEAKKILDTIDGDRTRLASLSEGVVQQIRAFRAKASERDRIVLLFATDKPLNNNQRKTLSDIKAMGQKRIGPLFDVQEVSVKTIYQRMRDETSVDYSDRTTLELKAELIPSGDDLLVGTVKLFDLYNFLKSYGEETGDLDRLYEKNVRRFLGAKGRVNKAIANTLEKSSHMFGLFNNGVTFVVQEFLPLDEHRVNLCEPFIVNGCQTTRTIYDVFHRKLESGGTGSDPQLEAWKKQAENGVIVVKIAKVGAKGETLLRDITRYTNSQNAVREKDFLAITEDFKTWARELSENRNIYLEIQRGGWDAQRALQRQNKAKKHFGEAANAFDLLKVYGAGWLGESGLAFGRNASFLPNGSVFNRIIRDDEGGERIETDDLYAAYLLQRSAREFKFGRGAETASRRLTKFFFYSVFVELLRELVKYARSESMGRKAVTKCILNLAEPENKTALSELLENSIKLVDEYMTPEAGKHNIFSEPLYAAEFNQNMNAFLKSEKFGKREHTKELYALIDEFRRSMDRKTSKETVSPLKQVVQACMDSKKQPVPVPDNDKVELQGEATKPSKAKKRSG